MDQNLETDAIERHVILRKIAWIALVLAQPPFIWAQQPFYTDNADVTPAAKIHIEVFNEHEVLVQISSVEIFRICEFCRLAQAARTADQIAGAVADRLANFPILN
jgi:hypothetical protein